MKRTRNAAFALLESMVGVAIFAIGVLALGASVENCMTAERANAADQRARLALENRMAEIESGAVAAEDSRHDELPGMFSGITLRETRTPLEKKNENDQNLAGLMRINLEADWKEGTRKESKEIFFYVFR